MTAIDIDAQVHAWFKDQIETSAPDEDVWVSSYPAIAPIEGQSVAGFMMVAWMTNPLLGQPHISTGSFVTGVPSEEAIRTSARGMVAKLSEDRSALLSQTTISENGQRRVFNLNDRKFRKN